MKRDLGPFVHYFPVTPLKKGEATPPHPHNQAHITYCGAGSFVMRRFAEDGKTVAAEKVVRAGTLRNSHVITRANVLHQLEALEDGTIYHCIFAHVGWDNRTVVEEYDGNESAYV